MADNSTLPATGDIIATDDIAGIKYQRMKLIHGNDGINNGDVSSTNPLPVTQIKPTTPTVTSVAASLISGTLIASNTNRKGLIVCNNTDSKIYILFGTGTASSSNFSCFLVSGGIFSLGNTDYTGQLNVISTTTNGTIQVTELT
jgi:hypothetical protein